MCGRFTFKLTATEFKNRFDIVRGQETVKDWSPRYNVGPTTSVICFRMGAEGRELFTAKWGLIPSGTVGAKPTGTFNAKAETLSKNPLFEAAFRARRCVVVASGFYEWQFLSSHVSQAYYITLRSGEPMAMAGLWESWRSPDDEEVPTCTICTTTSNSMLERIFDRMPVILPLKQIDRWLDPTNHDESSLMPLLAPFPSDELQTWPVCKDVGNVASQGAYLTKPVF